MDFHIRFGTAHRRLTRPAYAVGHTTLLGAPHINHESLRDKADQAFHFAPIDVTEEMARL